MTKLKMSDGLVSAMAKAIREWDGCSNKDCVKGCKAFSEQDPEYICGRQTHDYLSAIFPELQAQMDAAVKAERERCAESIEEMGALRGEQKCCGHGIGSPPECCGDPLLLISTSDAASVIRNGAKP